MKCLKTRVHASALVYGESGILIRGAPGSGKSQLMLELIQRANSHGIFARMVGDDRVSLQVRGGRLIAASIPSIEGLIEVRGSGLAAFSHLQSCVITHVIDMSDEYPPRMPEHHDLQTIIHNIVLKRLQLRHSMHGFCAAYGAVDLFLRKL